MKKELKRPNFKGADKNREFRVILEKIYSEIKIIGALRDKLDSTMGMVAKNTEDITMLNIKTSAIKDELTKINGKLANIEKDLGIIKTDFSKRLTHLEAIKS